MLVVVDYLDVNSFMVMVIVFFEGCDLKKILVMVDVYD